MQVIDGRLQVKVRIENRGTKHAILNEIMKKIIKITAIIVINIILAELPVFAQVEHDTLSPKLNINVIYFQNACQDFFKLANHEVIKVKAIGDNNTNNSRAFESGNSGISKGLKSILENWWRNNLSKRLNRVKKILSIVVKGEDALKKQFIAYVMIGTNLVIDVKFTTLFLKPAVIGLCVLSGNPFLIYIVAPLSPFVLGGMVRFVPIIIFRLIFFNIVRLNKSGMKALFIPWGLGNFAPLLFLKGSKADDLFYVNEIRKLSRIIEETVKVHTALSEQEKDSIEQYSIKLAADISSYQNCLREYDCRRFKVRGAKGYTMEKIVKNIIRVSAKAPLIHQLKMLVFRFFEIVHPGYKEGTRPLLFFGSTQEKEKIKSITVSKDITQEHLENIFWFDLHGYVQEHESKNGTPAEVIPVAVARFIRPVFKISGKEDLLEKVKDTSSGMLCFKGSIIAQGMGLYLIQSAI